MSFISIIIKNIKNLLPYLLLIAIYFFFVNLEARKSSYSNKSIEKQDKTLDNSSINDNKQTRIKIPVIPYKQ